MPNVNKLFRRLSIRAKLVVAFCLFGSAPLAVVGGFGALHAYVLMSDAVRDRLKAGVVMKAEEIQRYLQSVREDVRFLSRLPTLRALADTPADAAGEQRRRAALVGEAFLSFSRSRPAYYQIRYIDERGREIVRADFDGQRHYLVAREALQDKRDRYYFVEAMATPPDRVYVSPMDLNIEWGEIERPHKPVIRYAVTFRNTGGEARGIVIVNLYAARILGQVLALGQQIGSVALATAAGDYLTPAPSEGGGAGASVLTDFPRELAAAVLSGRAGTIVEPGLRGRIVAFAPIFAREDRTEFWVLAHTFSKTEVLSSIRSLQLLVFALGSGVLALALVLGVIAARHFTRPITALIQGAEAVARGDFDHRVRVETNDELEDLGGHFTRMAERLDRRERELREARERAERKAREAQALYRIGTEILALLSLPEILQTVADKARELLRADVAILCLGAAGDGLSIGAVSGATDALRLGPGDLLPAAACAKVSCPEAVCPATAFPSFPTHVAVALRSGAREVGNLCVAFAEPRPMGAEDQEFLSGLANLATIAIEKSRLHREVATLARLEERERIAQDLHDGIIQSIYAAGLGLEECVRLAGEAPGEAKARLAELIDALNVVIRDVRNYVVGLGPEHLRESDLGHSLAELAHGLALNGLLDLDLSLDPRIEGALPPERAGQLYHICREALTNAVKHARASRVTLDARREDGTVRVTVQDDGVGFDAGHVRGAGQGLRNMRERTRRLRGELAIESAPGRGTRITVAVPTEEPAVPAAEPA
ncbi:MAG: HAMP domain-containing protein [Candidatus Rokubacteria bacterium]|nr:HAMP domain-containing protein [Candidatus Rokubacteria bacterium]